MTKTERSVCAYDKLIDPKQFYMWWTVIRLCIRVRNNSLALNHYSVSAFNPKFIIYKHIYF